MVPQDESKSPVRGTRAGAEVRTVESMDVEALAHTATGALVGIALGFVVGLLTLNPMLGVIVGGVAMVVLAIAAVMLLPRGMYR
ncbi:Flp pilus assembly protein TadC [Microbacterium sp. TS-1]|nr:Flp pilus assembly protein TadC [Microbacterium sp. TS-1]